MIERSHLNSWHALLCLFVGLGVFLSWVIINSRLPTSTALTAALGCVILAPLLVDGLRGRFDPLGLKAIVTYAMVYFFLMPAVDLVLVLDPTAALDLDTTLLQYGYLSPEEDRLLSRTLLILVAGVMTFWYGFRLPKRSEAFANVTSYGDYWTSSALEWTGLAFISVALATVVLEVTVVGGWDQWLSATWYNRREGRYNELFNYLGMVKLMLMPGCFMLLVAALRRRSMIVWIVNITLIAGIIFILSLEGARRYPLGVLLGLVGIWHLGRSRLKAWNVPVLILVGMMAAIFLLPVRTSLREVSLRDVPAHSLAVLSQFPIGKLVREATEIIGGFDGLLALVQDVPSQVEPLWGSTYLKLLVFPIPRSVWPEKPGAFGEIFVAHFYPSTQNLSISATIMGEAYFNFLLPGVLGTMVVIGFLLRYLDDWALRFPSGSLRLVLHGMVIVMSFEIFRGPLFILTLYGFQFLAVTLANWGFRPVRSLSQVSSS